ncbi:MAG: ABC transporter substrate-binding protein [Alistipes sp.]|nr:ABC transporter substrate-binding protein [Alistipes sp.]
MKGFVYISTVIIAIFLCFGCGITQRNNSQSFDNIVYEPRHASGFEIAQDEAENRLIRVTRPWQGDAIVEQTLAVFSDAESIGGYQGQYIVGSAGRVVCMSSSHVAMLDAIGVVDCVVGVSGKDYIMNSAIVQNDSVVDVGYDSNLDYEALLSVHPDLVLMYGVTAENSAVTAKLRELNIPYLYLGDYTEQSPLGKAEWVVAVAEIMGCRERGEEVFRAIEERYNAVRESVDMAQRPKVMFNLPYQDVWYMPSDDSYMVRLIEDAGGEYIFKGENPTGGSRGISLEEALYLVGRADKWLNVGQVSTMAELYSVAPHFVNSAVVKRGEVYNNNRRKSQGGGSDFWESAIVRPDVVLQDLVNVMRGTGGLYYYHKLN